MATHCVNQQYLARLQYLIGHMHRDATILQGETPSHEHTWGIMNGSLTHLLIRKGPVMIQMFVPTNKVKFLLDDYA